jgi:hypothetical protein
MLTRFAAAVLLFASPLASRGQTPGVPPAASEPELSAGTIISGQSAREDVRLLRRIYSTLHPGMYRYNTPAQIERGFEDLETTLVTQSMTVTGLSLREAYLTLSRFLGTIKCGHTYANFFNQSKAFAAGVLDHSGRRVLTPFAFRWIGERMIVTENWSGEAALSRGAEVESINGRSAAEILAGLMPVARADGGNDGKRRQILEVSGRDRWEAFDVFFPLLYPPGSEEMVLRVKPAGVGEAREVRVRAMSKAERAAAIEKAGKGLGPLPGVEAIACPYDGWAYRTLDGNVAYLRMDGWALYNTDWKWALFLGEVVDHAITTKAADFIIDLRRNEGGLDCGDTLLARLIEQDLTLAATERRVRYVKVPEDLNPYLDTWDNSFRDWGARATAMGDGTYRLDGGGQPVGRTIAAKGPRYTGRVWVLVGPTNSSATFQFARIVKERGLGTLVGGTTGGNLRGINGGSFFFVRLPGTGIEVDLPLVALSPARGEGEPEPADAGLEPDVKVEDTAADVAAGRDTVLEAALAKIRGRGE